MSESAMQTGLEISDLQCHFLFTKFLPMPGTSMSGRFDPGTFLYNKVRQIVIIVSSHKAMFSCLIIRISRSGNNDFILQSKNQQDQKISRNHS